MTGSLAAQEIMTGLFENPVIKEEISKKTHSEEPFRDGQAEELQLPFFEDFTGDNIFSDPARWSNSNVYINTNFPYRSANRGAATFDAIDRNGNLHSNASTFPFLADSLVSLPIRLDSVFSPEARPVTTQDSVFFSFFYQPQGRGNNPEGQDSLALAFGYTTGNLVFAGYFDSIAVPANIYISLGDTIKPGDTIYSPYNVCDSGLYMISNKQYTYYDEITIPCDSIFIPEYAWNTVWNSPGLSLEEFFTIHGTYCEQVIIPVNDSSLYYRKDFRFKFYNYASLASDFNPSWRSNCDQWNVDYIYLNINRSASDTFYRDIGFVERAPSLLKEYEAMPYNQYINDPTNVIKDNLELMISNLNVTSSNTEYKYYVTDEFGLYPLTYPGGYCNLDPVWLSGYQNCIDCPQHACPPFNYIFATDFGDSASFRIDHILLGDFTPVDTIGDTLTHFQNFYNYYAYDDGSPEAGYGLTPAGARLAYKFNLNIRDTLRAVQMYFNRTYMNANDTYFSLMVWSDNNGEPGDIIYQKDFTKVGFSNSLTNFYTYMLEEEVPVNGVFYIGWQQMTSDNLNIGFDKFNNAQDKIFYNAGDGWYNSTFQGALMMRPLLGKEFSLIGIEEKTGIVTANLTIFPNPANRDRITISLPDEILRDNNETDFTIYISNILGQEIYSGPYDRVVSISSFKEGLYIVRVINHGKNINMTAKFIIAR